MPTELKMPKLSDNMEQGTIIRWLKQPGDSVRRGEPLAEVETDKADVEVEASESGVLREIRVAEGGEAAVGEVIAILGAENDDGVPSRKGDGAEPEGKDRAPRQQEAAKPAPPVAKTPPPRSANAEKRVEKKREEPRAETPASEETEEKRSGPQRVVRASPLAKRLAEAERIDLKRLRGSGPGGRIVRRDVEAALGRTRPGEEESAEPQAGEHKADDRPAARRREAAQPAAGAGEPSRMRAAIARRMTEAKRDVPHFYVATEIDMTEAMRLRRSIKSAQAIPDLTVTHVILKAVALALTRHPRANASWNGEATVFHEGVNIGIAVAVEDGLVVPVLHDAARLTLADIAERAGALVEKARQGKFSGEDLTGGTFSISNVGMIDVDDLVAVINPPQAAILATAAVKQRPFVRDGQLVVAETMRANLSCDHRVLNGVEGAEFLAEVKRLLESPVLLVL